MAKKVVLYAVLAMVSMFFSCADHIIESRFENSEEMPGNNVPANIQAIFNNNCAVSLCHNGIQMPNLSEGVAYINIVNISSSVGLDYIEPGDTTRSYLYLKITGASGITGARMPQQQLPLSDSDIALIRNWIENGAPAE